MRIEAIILRYGPGTSAFSIGSSIRNRFREYDARLIMGDKEARIIFNQGVEYMDIENMLRLFSTETELSIIGG